MKTPYVRAYRHSNQLAHLVLEALAKHGPLTLDELHYAPALQWLPNKDLRGLLSLLVQQGHVIVDTNDSTPRFVLATEEGVRS
jgi:hypothetical protein